MRIAWVLYSRIAFAALRKRDGDKDVTYNQVSCDFSFAVCEPAPGVYARRFARAAFSNRNVAAEVGMNGYQLTFYTEQNRKCGHLTFCEWLLHEVRKRGIRGATVISAAEGIGHAGTHHAAHILKLADQPVQIILAVTEHEADKILEAVRAENVHVFYTLAPIEFGLLGNDPPPKKAKTFFRFRRPTGSQLG